jgi:predicted  nucleic acid-binding Zn-ribbon protein
MFISNEEKQTINDKLRKLKETIDKVVTENIMLSAKIKVLEGKVASLPTKKTRVKVTDEHRKQKQREYNRRYALKKRQLVKEALNELVA